MLYNVGTSIEVHYTPSSSVVFTNILYCLVLHYESLLTVNCSSHWMFEIEF